MDRDEAIRLSSVNRELAEENRRLALSVAKLADDRERLERELGQERQDRKQADLDTIRALGERNDARKALLLAAEWGIAADGYSAEVAGAIRSWIIGGYKGDPPTVPDYYPKRKYEAVNPP